MMNLKIATTLILLMQLIQLSGCGKLEELTSGEENTSPPANGSRTTSNTPISFDNQTPNTNENSDYIFVRSNLEGTDLGLVMAPKCSPESSESATYKNNFDLFYELDDCITRIKVDGNPSSLKFHLKNKVTNELITKSLYVSDFYYINRLKTLYVQIPINVYEGCGGSHILFVKNLETGKEHFINVPFPTRGSVNKLESFFYTKDQITGVATSSSCQQTKVFTVNLNSNSFDFIYDNTHNEKLYPYFFSPVRFNVAYYNWYGEPSSFQTYGLKLGDKRVGCYVIDNYFLANPMASRTWGGNLQGQSYFAIAKLSDMENFFNKNSNFTSNGDSGDSTFIFNSKNELYSINAVEQTTSIKLEVLKWSANDLLTKMEGEFNIS